jgi:hypothetical protein
MALLAAGPAACGRKMPPQPILRAPPAAIRAWQREGEALVAWSMPGKGIEQRNGGLEGFELLIERLPARCPACPPLAARVASLAVGSAEWQVEGPLGFYRFPLPREPSLWRFRMATVYARGTTANSEVALLEAPADVPVHALAWEWADAEGSAAKRNRVRLFWKARRERIVRILSEQGTMIERERFFRANLYRRGGGRPWPLAPLNARPFQARHAVLALEPGEGRAPVWQFTIRLVDEFGNEGPAAPPVTIPAPAGRP